MAKSKRGGASSAMASAAAAAGEMAGKWRSVALKKMALA
jgi:hypothetical protein